MGRKGNWLDSRRMPFYLLYEHVWWGGGGVPRVGACCSQKTPIMLLFTCLSQGLLLLRRLTNEARLGRDPLLSTSHPAPPCLAFYLGSEVPSLGHRTCKASVVQPGHLFPPLFKDHLLLSFLPSLPFILLLWHPRIFIRQLPTELRWKVSVRV